MINRGASLNMEYRLSDTITLKSISAYCNIKWRGIRDGDNTPFTILHTDYSSRGEQYSQKFQALYNTDRLSGVLGAYYFEENVQDILVVDLGNRTPQDSDNNRVKNDSWALFGQATYDFTDALSITGGIRHTEETKRSLPEQFDHTDLADGVLISDPQPDCTDAGEYYLPPIWYSRDFSATTFSASLNYRCNDSIMTYASYSQGFKGGGFNSAFNVPQSASSWLIFTNSTTNQLKLLRLALNLIC